MATETPLLHQSQCTAGVNMSSTGALSGFLGTGQFLVVSLTAARSVIIAALGTSVPLGVAQNDPISGFVADIGYHGITKVITGAAVAAGARLQTAGDGTGRAITYTSAVYYWGIALEASTAANQLVTAYVFFPGQLGGLL
jgi:hypothetical protein